MKVSFDLDKKNGEHYTHHSPINFYFHY